MEICYARDYESKYAYLDWASRLLCKYGLKKEYDFFELKETNIHNLPFDTDKIKESSDSKNISWYIYNYFNCKTFPYDSNFLHGVLEHTRFYTEHLQYPSFFWSKNVILEDYFLNSSLPYFEIKNQKTNNLSYCLNVPLIHMNYEKDHRYIAGVLCMGKIRTYPVTGLKYAFYNKKFEDILYDLKIPIDVIYGNKIGISLVWPAIASIECPSYIKKRWLNIKEAYVGNYPEILLRTYVKKSLVTDIRLPYCFRRDHIVLKYNKLGGLKFLDKYIDYKNMWTVDKRMQTLINSWKNINNTVY